MKEKHEKKLRVVDEKQQFNDKSDKGLFIYTSILLTIIGIGIIAGSEPVEPNVQILFAIPAILIIIIGVCLFIFFNKQYVNITELNGNIVFDKYNGKQKKLKPEDIEYIEDKYSYYYIYLKTGEKLPMFKRLRYPDAAAHERKLKQQVEHLQSLGVQVKK